VAAAAAGATFCLQMPERVLATTGAFAKIVELLVGE